MDVILDLADSFVFDDLYTKVVAPQHFNPTKKALPQSFLSLLEDRSNIWRQTLTLYIITWSLGTLTYLVCASLSYIFVFDKSTFEHPRFFKNQINLEIKQALASTPVITLLTVPVFVLEVRGYSRLYLTTAEGPGLWYDIAQFFLFLLFTDFGIYWIHRFLHHPLVYKHIHKPHHKWVVPTPFAAVAFHPVDGYLQSLPYHIYPFLFPLRKDMYLVLFAFVQIWTVVIHDGEFISRSVVINGAACHTIHHLYSRHNFGQFTTLWDRVCGSYRQPDEQLLKGGGKLAGLGKKDE